MADNRLCTEDQSQAMQMSCDVSEPQNQFKPLCRFREVLAFRVFRV